MLDRGELNNITPCSQHILCDPYFLNDRVRHVESATGTNNTTEQ